MSVSWDVCDIEQSQTYYAVRVDDAEVTFEPRPRRGRQPLTYRWWTVAELLHSGDDTASGIRWVMEAAVPATQSQ